MKELFQQYVAYNFWATKQLTDVIKELPEDVIHKTVASSFPSLYKTVQHMWLAEEAWWKRHKLLENFTIDSEKFDGSFSDLVNELQKQSTLWLNWVNNCTEAQLQHVFAYIRNKQEEKLATYKMLLHVHNHATYHRGQLVTMLRQLGVEKIPAIDFTAYCRTVKS